MPNMPAPPPSEFVMIGGQKIHRRAQLDELDRTDAEEDLHFFLRKAWRYIDPAPFIDGWVLDALCEHLEAVCDGTIKRLLINIPPRMGKSSVISVAFGTWVWAQTSISPVSGPQVPILFASYAHTLARRDSIKRRRLIKSAWYQRLFGDRFQISEDQDTKERFSNNRGGEMLITSVDSGITGEGGNIVVVDDPNNAREILSESVAQSTNEDWWDGAMPTRLNDASNGAIIVVQQRLGEEDLSGHILDNDKRGDWDHLVLPMHFEESRRATTSIGWTDPRTYEGELLCPERFDEAAVLEIATRLGKWRASGQHEQRPEPKGGGIIQRDWWQMWPPNGEVVDDQGKPIKPLEFPPMSYILGSLDTAFTENTMNDPSAMTVWGVFSQASEINLPTRIIRRETQGGSVIQVYGSEADVVELTRPRAIPKVMLLYAWSGYYELHKLLKKVDDTCKAFQVDCLMIENKSRGHDVGVELRRTLQDGKYSIYMNEVPGGLDKVARLYSVQHLFEEKMVFAPERPWAEAVISQCGTFPNAKHDDLVDTCIHSANILMADGTAKDISEMRIGEMVQTPIGPRRVLEAACTGIKPVWYFAWTEGAMEATANHPIWADGAWKRLDEIKPCDTLSSWHGKLNPALLSSPFTSTAISTTDTPRLRNVIIAVTSVVAAVRHFIERSGNAIAEKFLRVGMCTTRTGTHSTIECATSTAFPRKSIDVNTWPSTLLAVDHLNNGLTSQQLTPKLPHGIDHPQVKRGISNTTAICVHNLRIEKPVYNLRVEEAECYYANGILVHNCSQALRRLRTMGLLSRPPELQAAASESIKHISRRARRPLYPGSRAV
jgi:predicted phage terminase large subunit-like protein